MSKLKWVVFHHTNEGLWRPGVIETASYQTGTTAHIDFPAIAYTVYIEASGKAYLCHNLTTVTWGQGEGSPTNKQGVGSYNWEGIAVVFAGENPLEAQVITMKKVADYIELLVGHKLARIGHKDLSSTVCPGKQWLDWKARVQ